MNTKDFNCIDLKDEMYGYIEVVEINNNLRKHIGLYGYIYDIDSWYFNGTLKFYKTKDNQYYYYSKCGILCFIFPDFRKVGFLFNGRFIEYGKIVNISKTPFNHKESKIDKYFKTYENLTILHKDYKKVKNLLDREGIKYE